MPMQDVFEWFNLWLAFPLTLLGLGLAYREARRSKTAAEASKTAAESAQQAVENSAKQSKSNLLLAILPQLSHVESNLEWAVDEDNRSATLHYLASWRWQAGQVRGLLDGDEPNNEEILTLLQKSIAAAANAKDQMRSATGDPLSKQGRAALKAIAEVTGLVGEITASHAIDGG